MPRQDVTIQTSDGVCPASLFTPGTGSGPWPGVIFFMDGLGIRPAMWEMGQKLADAGYTVLLPDAYYRFGAYPPMNPGETFADTAKRTKLMEWVGSLTRERKVADMDAYIKFLAARPEVKNPVFGATGYCMGGQAALTAAGAFPGSFAAIASFHGGNLAADAPDSPHQFAGNIKARLYIAGAIEDPSFDETQKARLEKALTDAKVDHVVETYDGAYHGFAVRDLPVYNEAAAARHWDALLKLFRETLG
ncbi:MAG TPA: dienelactone hydrolase family protein [Acidocella sp.]|jgi:carboxymethylenebutenolidase|nr:dienelactone hydrolase family protein [Acidocella sp.]